jgi:hypothetical protein
VNPIILPGQANMNMNNNIIAGRAAPVANTAATVQQK